MNHVTTHLDLASPIGQLRICARDHAIVGLDLPNHANAPQCGNSEARPDNPTLQRAAAQLQQYFAGTRRRFDLPLAAGGTEFQRIVWSALALIPFGETRSYGQIARQIGRPSASRAIGAANGRNPISIIVPCHRVIGADGSLIGYGGGEPAKRWLLDHEASVAGSRLPLE